jgi:hypothetical protein
VGSGRVGGHGATRLIGRRGARVAASQQQASGRNGTDGGKSRTHNVWKRK